MQPVSGSADVKLQEDSSTTSMSTAIPVSAPTRGAGLPFQVPEDFPIRSPEELAWFRRLNSEGSVAVTTRLCLKELLALLRLYGMTGVPMEKEDRFLDKQCTHYQELAYLVSPDPSVNWVPVLKWKLVAFHNALRNQDPPTPPNVHGEWHEDPLMIVGGAAGRWLKAVTHGRGQFPAAKLHSLAVSVKLAKQVMVRPDTDFVRASLKKSFVTLTSEPQGPQRVDILHSLSPVVPDAAGGIMNLSTWHAWHHGNLRDILEDAGFPTVIDRQVLDDQFRRVVDECLNLQEAGSFTDEDRYRPLFPSTSAHYNSSRYRGGGVTGLRSADIWGESAFQVRQDLAYFEKHQKLFQGDDEMLQKNFEMKRWIEDEVGTEPLLRSHLVRPFLNVSHGDIEHEERVPHRFSVLEFSSDQLNSAYRSLYQRCLAVASQEVSFASLLGLTEALKSRIISAQSSVLQFVLRPLQKWLHGALRRHRTFKLLGEPNVTSEMLRNTLGAELPDGEFFRSGDWSDATNQIFTWPSVSLMTAIAAKIGLTDTEHSVACVSLAHNIIVDSSDDRRNPRQAQQKRGQLMGGILSFPLLCLANAAVCRAGIEYGEALRLIQDANPGVDIFSDVELKRPANLKGVRRPLKQHALLINGDDNASRQTFLGSRVQNVFGEFIGLNVSVGKDYLTRDFVEINSTQFSYDPENPIPFQARRGADVLTRYSPFRLVQFVRMGLLRGMKRSEGVVGMADVFTAAGCDNLGSRCRALIAGTPPDLQESVLRLFIDSHRRVLDKLHVPWFVPEWLGGVGLPPLRRFNAATGENEWIPGLSPTDLDLALGHRIYHQMLAGSSAPLAVAPPSTWRVHKFIQSSVDIVTRHSHEVSDSELDSSTKLYSALAAEAFLVLPLHRLIDPDPYDPSIKTLRHNEKLWRIPKGADGRPHVPGQSHRLSMEFLMSSPSFVSLLMPLVPGRQVKRAGKAPLPVPAVTSLPIEVELD